MSMCTLVIVVCTLFCRNFVLYCLSTMEQLMGCGTVVYRVGGANMGQVTVGCPRVVQAGICIVRATSIWTWSGCG